jgi:peptide/nickel transport system substrate-binding protein
MTFPIVSEHHYEQSTFNKTNIQRLPIGTGPYMFSEYQEKKSIKLTANEKWWNEKTNIPSVKIMLFENNRNMKTLFQTNKCDVLTVDSLDYKGYSLRTGIITREYIGNSFEFISFNTENKVLSDKNVRNAIAYLIDIQQIVTEVLENTAVTSVLPILPDSWVLGNKKLKLVPNPGKALELIDECGWSFKNKKFKKNIDGKKYELKFELLVSSENILRLKTANAIKQQMESNNIMVDIKEVTWDEQIELINKGEYDMALSGCRLSSIPDISYLYSDTYLSYGNSGKSEICRNISGYKSEEADNLIKEIFAEHDEEMKITLFDKLTDVVYDDMPYMGLYIYRNAIIVNEYVRGSIKPYVWDVLNDIKEWYVTPR